MSPNHRWPRLIRTIHLYLGLFTSVLTGLYMAWRFSRRPGLFGSVLVGGIAVPLLLLF